MTEIHKENPLYIADLTKKEQEVLSRLGALVYFDALRRLRLTLALVGAVSGLVVMSAGIVSFSNLRDAVVSNTSQRLSNETDLRFKIEKAVTDRMEDRIEVAERLRIEAAALSNEAASLADGLRNAESDLRRNSAKVALMFQADLGSIREQVSQVRQTLSAIESLARKPNSTDPKIATER